MGLTGFLWAGSGIKRLHNFGPWAVGGCGAQIPPGQVPLAGVLLSKMRTRAWVPVPSIPSPVHRLEQDESGNLWV